MTKSKLTIIIVAVLALIGTGAYYYQGAPKGASPAQPAQAVQEAPRNPISGKDGSFEGSIAAISSSTLDVADKQGSKISFVITSDVPVVRTTSIDAASLKGQLAVVSVRPGTREAYSVTVFADKKDLPAPSAGQSDDSVLGGTIADVSPDSISIKDAKGAAKSVALATTTQMMKVESLDISSLREGDQVKVVWFMGEDNAPHVGGVYVALTYQ